MPIDDYSIKPPERPRDFARHGPLIRLITDQGFLSGYKFKPFPEVPMELRTVEQIVDKFDGLLTNNCFDWVVNQPSLWKKKTVEEAVVHMNDLVKQYKTEQFLLGKADSSEPLEI